MVDQLGIAFCSRRQWHFGGNVPWLPDDVCNSHDAELRAQVGPYNNWLLNVLPLQVFHHGMGPSLHVYFDST